MLTEADFIRYRRQILYPDFGESGQERSIHFFIILFSEGW